MRRIALSSFFVLICSHAALAQSLSLGLATSAHRYRSSGQPMMGAASTSNPIEALVYSHDEDPTYKDSFSNSGARANGQGIARIPSVVVCSSGTKLLFYESRIGYQDYQAAAIYVKRCVNGVWGTPVKVIERTDYASNSKWLGNPTPGQAPNGTIVCLFQKWDDSAGTKYTTAWKVTSTDDGATWGAASEISQSIIKFSNTQYLTNGGSGAGTGTNGTIPTDYTGGADSSNARWNEIYLGPTPIVVQSSRMVAGMYHRYTAGGNSYANCIYSDDNGSTWNLGAGYVETTATRGTNENTVIVTSGGSLYFNHRNVNNSNRQDLTVANATTSWGSTVHNMTNGSSDFTFSSSQGAMCRMANGDLILTAPMQAATIAGTARSTRLGVYMSTDSGATWTFKRVLHFQGARYSALWPVDASTIDCVFEGTYDDFVDTTPYEYLFYRRFNRTWLTGTAESTFAQFKWDFNEESNGTKFPTAFSGILDRGNGRMVYGQNAIGFSGGTYTSTGGSTNGTTAGVILQQAYSSSTYGGPLDPATESWTMEVSDLNLASTTAGKVIIDSKAGSNGVRLSMSTTNRLSLSITDTGGAAAAAITGNNAVTAGTPFDLRLERDVAADVVRIYIDGVQSGSSGADNTTAAVIGTGPLVIGSNATAPYATNPMQCTWTSARVTRGILTSGFLTGNETKKTPVAFAGVNTSALPSTFPQGGDEATQQEKCVLSLFNSYGSGRNIRSDTISRTGTITGAANNGSGLIRITSTSHGLSTGDRVYIYSVGGTTEANTDTAASSVGAPWTVTAIAANTFDLQGSTFANAYTSGGTWWMYEGGNDFVRMPLTAGTGGTTTINSLATTERWHTEGAPPGQSRCFWYITDSYVGGLFRLSFSDSGPANGFVSCAKQLAGTRYDFMHNTGSFVLAFVAKFYGDPGVNQPIFDQSSDGSSPGITLMRQTSSNRLYLRMRRSGADTFAGETITTTNAPTLAANKPYFIAVVGRGDGNPVNVYWADYTSSATVTKCSTSGNYTNGADVNSTDKLCIGAKPTDATRAANMAIKNVYIYNSSSTTSGNVGSDSFIQSLSTFSGQN